MKRWLMILPISMLCLPQSGMALDESPEPDAEVFDLGRITVKAQAIPLAESGEAVIKLDVIERHESRDLGEALNLLPGIVTSRTGSRNEVTLNLRGFEQRQVPVFIDGVPVYVPYDGTVDLSRFSTQDLSELRVAKGFSSLLYGPNALGGAVNLVSRKPASSFEGDARVGYLSGESENSSGMEAGLNLGARWKHFYAQGGVSLLDMDGFALSGNYNGQSGEDGEARDNSMRRDERFSLKLGWVANDNHELAVGFADQHGEKGTPPYSGLNENARARFWTWPNWDKQSLYAISQHRFGKAYLKTRFYHDTFENTLESYDDDTYSSQIRGYAFTSIYDDYTFGGSLEAGYALSAINTPRFAIHLKDDVHREHGPSEPERSFEDRTLSIALEDAHKISSKTQLVAGLSFDSREALAAEDYDGTSISSFALESSSAWNTQIQLSHAIRPGHQIRLSLARKTRLATLKDRYSYRSGRSLPNPELDPEQALHLEAGWTMPLARSGHFGISLFQTRITDLMQFVGIGDVDNDGEDEDQIQNIGEVRNLGTELSLQIQAADGLHTGMAWSWLLRENISDPEIWLTGTPRNQLLLWADWMILDDWALQGSLTHESGRTSTSDGQFGTDASTRLNLKLGYSLHRNLQVEAGARNILDENWEMDEGFPEAGREWFLRLKGSFKN